MLREAVLLYETFVVVFGGAEIRWGRTLAFCYGVRYTLQANALRLMTMAGAGCDLRHFSRHRVDQLRQCQQLLVRLFD